MADSIFEKCQPSSCEGWLCAIATPQQFVTLLAAIAGIPLIGLVIVCLVKAPIADVGAGLAGLMAVGLALLSLPMIGKLSLSFAANQGVSLEFKTTPSAENICNTANLVTEISKPLIQRVAKLERVLQSLERSSGIARALVTDPVQQRLGDVRIFYRGTRAADAEKLRRALVPMFSFVDAIRTDLTEVGATEVPGYNRVRYETIPLNTWMSDATFVGSVVTRELGKLDRGLDAIKKALPGNIQVPLY